MDWQHLIMNGENLAEYAALLAAEGLLGHQHANSGWGTFDDDNMVGATAFMETLELAVEFRRCGYGENGERLGFDLYPYTEDAVEAVQPERAAVALHRRDRRADRRRGALARRSRARTRSAPTSSCTPRSARDFPRRARRRYDRGQGGGDLGRGRGARAGGGGVSALDPAARAGPSRTRRTGGGRASGRSRRWARTTPPRSG